MACVSLIRKRESTQEKKKSHRGWKGRRMLGTSVDADAYLGYAATKLRLSIVGSIHSLRSCPLHPHTQLLPS